MESVIRLEGVTKILRSDIAGRHLYTLGPLDFEVMPGQIFGYLGPNGAGKTTTIKLIMGLLRPTRGQILCFGRPSWSVSARQRIGFLPEQPYFYQHLSARELLGFYGNLFRLSGPDLTGRIERLLHMVGLEGHGDTRLSGFSKGMLQRIGLAQTLVNNPDLVILDEPLSGLDPVGRREMRDLIVRLKSEGRTVFFSSHILQDVEMICDRVAILTDGKVLRIADVSDVLYGSLASYEILVSDAPPETIRKLDLGTISVMGDKTVVTMPPGTALNTGLNRLMALGVRIESVTPLRRTLEDYFMTELQVQGHRSAKEPQSEQGLLAGSSEGGTR